MAATKSVDQDPEADTAAEPSEAPRVSVGLIVYNGERYLESAIETLLAQTYTDFELIISDNGSTDGTERIARETVERDSRVRYARSDVNRGVSWNLNNVVHLARGTYFMWAGHDDIHGPEFIARCVAALEADPEVVYAYGTTYLMDGDGHVFGREANHFNLASRSPNKRFWEQLIVKGGQNFYGMIPLATLRSIAPHGSTPWAERVMYAELSLRGRFVVVPGHLFYWRRHPDQLTASWDSRATFTAALNPDRPKWRLTTPALMVEYVAGYVGAINRSPLGFGERLRCYARLSRWLLGRVPGLQVRDPRTGEVEILPAGPDDQFSSAAAPSGDG